MHDYSKDREILNNLLLTIKDIRKEKILILNIVPELIICDKCTQQHPAHIYNVLDHIFQTVNKVDNILILKLAALLHDIGKPYKKVLINSTERFWGHETTSAEMAKYVFIRLGYEEDFINQICTLIKYHDYKTYPNKESLSQTIDLVGKNLIPYLFKLQTADLLSHEENYCNRLLSVLNKTIDFYNNNYLHKDYDNS